MTSNYSVQVITIFHTPAILVLTEVKNLFGVSLSLASP